MTQEELLKKIGEYGGEFAPATTIGNMNITNINLQKMRIAMLPTYMVNLYQTCGGIMLGSGYIFGPSQVSYNNKHPVPNLIQITQDLSNIPAMQGKTLFGRNDLFWFVFDSFGNCFMLDNTNLRVLRKYQDPYKCIYDCLVGGRF